MDDSQDKIRRNFVVFSSLVIAIHYLGLTVDDVIGALLKNKINIVAPDRTWDVGVVIFIYLTYRYATSEDARKTLEKIILDWHLYFEKRLDEYLQKISIHALRKASTNNTEVVLHQSTENDFPFLEKGNVVERTNVMHINTPRPALTWRLLAKNSYIIFITINSVGDMSKFVKYFGKQGFAIENASGSTTLPFRAEIAPSWFFALNVSFFALLRLIFSSSAADLLPALAVFAGAGYVFLQHF